MLKKSNFNILLLEAFIIASLLFGSFHIGVFSLRVYLSVIMFFYMVITRKKNTKNLILKRFPIYLFLIFLFVTFICKLISSFLSDFQYDEVEPFSKLLLSAFFIDIVAYFAISKFVQNEKDIKHILNLLIVICIINAVVTFLQSQGNILGIAFGKIFVTGENHTYSRLEDLIHQLSEMYTQLPGIYGHGAINGYMAACLGVLPMYYLFKRKASLKTKTIAIVCVLIAIVGSFWTQERSSLGLLLIFNIYCLVKGGTKMWGILVILALAVLLIINADNLTNLIESKEAGRFSRINDFGDDRIVLVRNFLAFIPNHLFFGGQALYDSIYGMVPHNFFLHALIYSGLIGCILIYWLFFYILKDAIRILVNKNTYQISFVFACALMIYQINSVFHSSSLITGEVAIWLLYALMLRANQIEKIIK